MISIAKVARVPPMISEAISFQMKLPRRGMLEKSGRTRRTEKKRADDPERIDDTMKKRVDHLTRDPTVVIKVAERETLYIEGMRNASDKVMQMKKRANA